MQHAIAGLTHTSESLPSYIKQAKVIGVHRDDHSLDIAFLDGSTARHVPLLSGWLGSTHGAVGMTAPSYDKNVLAKKTYPGTTSADVVHSKTNTSAEGRDQYCLVAQLEGHGFGSSGFVALGFFAPQVSEMLFSKDSPDEPDAFADMMLVRHSSDVQSTIDKNGTVSIQHPTGTRITIGTGAVNLTKKDYDKRYELRENKESWKDIEAIVTGPGDNAPEVKASLTLQVAAHADLYGQQQVTLHTKTKTHIEMAEAGTIDIFASEQVTIHVTGGSTVTLAGGDITIHAPGTVAVTASHISLNG